MEIQRQSGVESPGELESEPASKREPSKDQKGQLSSGKVKYVKKNTSRKHTAKNKKLKI